MSKNCSCRCRQSQNYCNIATVGCWTPPFNIQRPPPITSPSFTPQFISFESGIGTVAVPLGVTTIQYLIAGGGGGAGRAAAIIEPFEEGGGGGGGGRSIVSIGSIPAVGINNISFVVGAGGLKVSQITQETQVGPLHFSC